MGDYVAHELLKNEEKNIRTKGSNILIMGLTFKENCADIRNSGIQSVIKKLKNNGVILIYMIHG